MRHAMPVDAHSQRPSCTRVSVREPEYVHIRERDVGGGGEREGRKRVVKLHIVDTGIHRTMYTNHIGRYLLPYYVGHVHS